MPCSAHRALADGGAADVRAAAAERMRAVTVVVEAAVRALGRSAGGLADARFRIAGTVEALASGGLPADVAPGRLTRDLQASGLDALSTLGRWAAVTPSVTHSRPVLVRSPPLAHPPNADHARAEASARRSAQHRAAAEARLASAEAALRDVTLEAHVKATALEEARAVHAASARQVADLERQLEAARADADVARRALTEATKQAGEAEIHRARAAREVARAHEQLAGPSARDAPGR